MVCNGDKKFWSEKPMEVKRVKTVANTKATTQIPRPKTYMHFCKYRKQQQ
jgi:hypothetical protein